jgi:putative transposase
VDLELFTAVDQTWATDITYIPLQRGFLYRVDVVDLFPSHAFSWRLSNSLATEFCLDAQEMAIAGGRRPEAFRSDQGCQFTSADFIARLQAEEISISWSGRKRYDDNNLEERLWPTVKYANAGFSPKASSGVPTCLQRWMGARNQPGSVLMEVLPAKAPQCAGRQTPHEVYAEFDPCPPVLG